MSREQVVERQWQMFEAGPRMVEGGCFPGSACCGGRGPEAFSREEMVEASRVAQAREAQMRRENPGVWVGDVVSVEQRMMDADRLVRSFRGMVNE